jgi:formylglycine-generating enzyme required for sulfatase activity
MGTNPSLFKCDARPVEQVSWNDVQDFLRKLNARNDGYRYRLPTEAEWEYAARAGTTVPYGGSGNLDAIAWYAGNSAGQTHPVGQKQPNAWGLYDMLGNVWELVQDLYDQAYYKVSPAVDPIGPENGYRHVMRGGSFGGEGREASPPLSFRRGGIDVELTIGVAGFGFRCVREAMH